MNNDVLEYIMNYQSFNETDIAFIMHCMFKDNYKTDYKGQWYEFRDEWVAVDSFDVRELIKTKVSTMILNCVKYIKENLVKKSKEQINTKEIYDNALNNLAEKRQLLRDQNRIDEECIIKQHIKKVIEYKTNIDYNKVDLNTLDPIKIMKSINVKPFKDRVMEQAAGLFVKAE